MDAKLNKKNFPFFFFNYKKNVKVTERRIGMKEFVDLLENNQVNLTKSQLIRCAQIS
jgi:hypothetical protein